MNLTEVENGRNQTNLSSFEIIFFGDINAFFGTPTTTVTTTAQDTVLRILFPCQATKTDGCYVKRSTAIRSYGRLSLGLWALVVLALTSIFVLADDVGPEPSLLLYNSDPDVDEDFTSTINTSPNDTLKEIQDENDLSGSSFDDSNGALSKRWNDHSAPLGASWMNYRMIQQNIVWGPWKPATCAQVNTAETPERVLLVLAVVSHASWQKGFSFKFGQESALEIEVVVSKTVVWSDSQWYVIPANSTGQVWVQQRFVYQQQQRQKCTKHHYGKGGVRCGKWRGPYNATLPANGLAFGWSVGWDKMDWNSCGP